MSDVPGLIHVVISLDNGGLERLVVDWTNERNRRHPGSTSVCCLDKPGRLAAQLEGDVMVCLDAQRSRFPWDRSAVRRLKSAIRDQKSCVRSMVLHAHNMAAWQYAVVAAKGLDAKVVYTQHGINVHDQAFGNRARSRLLSWFTHRAVAVSDSTASAMARKQGMSRRAITVVTNGVSPHRQYSAGELESLRKELDIVDGGRVIGSVGRLSHVKGHDRLLRAFARLRPDTHTLVLVGDGPERDTLERQAREAGIEAKVRFVGYKSASRKYLGLMDLFVLPSRSEGLSLALLEAMAAGVPVVVTDVGASREVIDDGRCGGLLPENEGEWTSTLQDQMKQDTARMTEAAKRRVRDHYSLEATVKAYEKVYEETVGSS